MRLPKPLLERTVLAKYLLLRGEAELTASGPFAPGLAVAQFQDAIEILLRVIAEYLGAAVKERTTFEQLIDAIEDAHSERVTHRSALNQLNKARVNFKHFALVPRRDDAVKLAADATSFFRMALETYFDLSFESVSLHDLVGHRRTQNWLAKAATSLSSARFKDCITECAVALAIFRSTLERDHRTTTLDQFRDVTDHGLKRVLEQVESQLDRLQEQLDLLFDGVDLPSYKRFLRYAPIVQLSDAKTVYLHEPPGAEIPIGPEEAAFCYRFATDTILALKEAHVPARFAFPIDIGMEFEVVEEGDLIVWPGDNLEVIRQAVKGERLQAPKRLRRQ